MKVKLLLVPLIIIIVIVLLIWFVYPAFSNGTDGIREKYSQWKAEQNKLADIQKKAANVNSLWTQLSANADKKDIVVKFIPENIKEEEIIDNLNFMASSSAVAVLKDSVSQPVISLIPDSGNVSGVAASTNPADPAAVQPAPQASDFNVNLSVVGSYENIKSIFDKLNSFSRYDEMATLEIKSLASATGGVVAPSDDLEADMVLNFNYFPKDSLKSDTNPIFLSNSLNLSAADEIKSAKNGDVLQLNIDQQGKTNPFLP